MSGTKCRLCQCLVDKQTGFSCSLNDDGFRSMIKIVFPFPVTPVHKVASKTYNMPVLVCFQCSTAIRNFYNFSKQVEVIQKKLQAECLRKDDSLSIDEMLLYIKAEPGLRVDIGDENTTESLMMSADVEDSGGVSRNIPNHTGISEYNNGDSSEPNDQLIEQDEEEEVIELAENDVSCVGKPEMIKCITMMERRINTATEKLDAALQNLQNPFPESFKFDLITTREECTDFNNRLADMEYMKKVLDWINGYILSQDTSRKRISRTVNLLFSKQFLGLCTWTGVGRSNERNIPFRSYGHILTLLRCAATTQKNCVNDRMVMKIMMDRFKNVRLRWLRPKQNKKISTEN